LPLPEYPPSDEELARMAEEKTKGNAISRTYNDIVAAIKDMPLTMKQLIPVKFFTWYAMFCYWQYLTSALSLSLFDTLDEQTAGFKQAQVLTGQMNGTYNIFCFLLAFALVPLAIRVGAKGVHFFCLLLGGIGLLAIPSLSITNVLFYQLLAGSIPKDKTGVYMGIFNLFIVIPMIIQIFTMQFFVYDLLGKNPVNVIRLAGVFLILGGFFTLFIKERKGGNTIVSEGI